MIVKAAKVSGRRIPGRRARPLREDAVLQACLQAYARIRRDRWLADRALDVTLREKRALFSHERREVANRIYALLRHQITVDFALAGTASGFETRSTSEQDLLRLCAARVLEGAPLDAVARSARLPASDAAVIEGLARATQAMDGWDLARRLSIGGSMPDLLVERFIREFGDEAQPLVDSLNQRAPLTIRANTLKTGRDRLSTVLKREGVATRHASLSELALILEDRPNAFGLQAFREGLFEIQDEGSQLLGMLVDAPPKLIVDACAGTGGKALQLAAQMNNRGEIHALDIHANRLDQLKKRARRAGAHNIRTRLLSPDGTDPPSDLVARADRVLIDAPCSGTGTYRRKPDARYRLTIDEIEMHRVRQMRLLEQFAPLVKPNGRLIYGTCSLLRDENGSVVEWFLRENANFSLLEPEAILGETLARQVSRGGYLQLFPHVHGTDGFFGAVLRRG